MMTLKNDPDPIGNFPEMGGLKKIKNAGPADAGPAFLSAKSPEDPLFDGSTDHGAGFFRNSNIVKTTGDFGFVIAINAVFASFYYAVSDTIYSPEGVFSR